VRWLAQANDRVLMTNAMSVYFGEINLELELTAPGFSHTFFNIHYIVSVGKRSFRRKIWVHMSTGD
jgi:hypothetical protein